MALLSLIRCVIFCLFSAEYDIISFQAQFLACCTLCRGFSGHKCRYVTEQLSLQWSEWMSECRHVSETLSCERCWCLCLCNHQSPAYVCGGSFFGLVGRCLCFLLNVCMPCHLQSAQELILVGFPSPPHTQPSTLQLFITSCI